MNQSPSSEHCVLLSSWTRGMSYSDATSHSPLWHECSSVHDSSGRCVISPHRGDLNGASVNAALQHAVSCAQHPHAQRRLLVQNDPGLASAGRSPLSCFKQTINILGGRRSFPIVRHCGSSGTTWNPPTFTDPSWPLKIYRFPFAPCQQSETLAGIYSAPFGLRVASEFILSETNLCFTFTESDLKAIGEKFL